MNADTEHVNGSAPTAQTRAERKAADALADLRRIETQEEIQRRREDAADARRVRVEQARRQRSEQRRTDREQMRARWVSRLARWWHAFVLVGAIVGVNIVAVAGQINAFQADPFSWPAAGAFGAAAVVESIAIFVGWHAHVALREGDSVFRLRVASYGIAAAVAALNYHHYAPTWALDDRAAMFGAASLLSPWLWAIHSRHLHRQDLRKQGLIDPRAPKFSALRWLLHRPETWQALKWAVRHGEQSPTAAILSVQSENGLTAAVLYVDRAHAALAAGRDALIRAQAAALAATETYALALERSVSEVSEIATPANVEIEPECDTSANAQPDALDVSEVADEEKRERPDAQDNRDAEKWIRAAMRKGKTPKQADIAARWSGSNGWASLRVKAARAALEAEGYRFYPAGVVKPPADADTSTDAADVSDTDAELSAAPTGDQS